MAYFFFEAFFADFFFAAAFFFTGFFLEAFLAAFFFTDFVEPPEKIRSQPSAKSFDDPVFTV